jgi:hypothetical protein
MSSAIIPPIRHENCQAELRRQIQALAARLQPYVLAERRRDDRVAIPLLFRLMPLDADWRLCEGESIIVVGKNISQRGLSFYHEQPIPYRRAAISLADPRYGDFAAEIDVRWCRFTRPGWYESGGRLTRALSHTEVESGPEGEVRLTQPAVVG